MCFIKKSNLKNEILKEVKYLELQKERSSILLFHLDISNKLFLKCSFFHGFVTVCLCGQKKETHYSCWLMTKSSLFLWESQNKDLASQYISSFRPNVFMRHFMVQKVFAICAANNSTSFIYYPNSNFLPNFLCAKTKMFKVCNLGYIYIFSLLH